MPARKPPSGPVVQKPGTAAAKLSRDSYEASRVKADPAAAERESAPEVSRGAWRERAFVPRGFMPADEVVSGLETALRDAQAKPTVAAAREALRGAWAPLLRQAVEQGGGDGLDAAVRATLGLPGPAGLDPLVGQLCLAMRNLGAATRLPDLTSAARAAIRAVTEAVDPDSATRISLKVIERQLEGRIDVDALLEILFATDDELAGRRAQVDRTLDSLREQLKAMPGVQPDGMYSNYTRLKVEKQLVDAELARRAGRP